MRPVKPRTTLFVFALLLLETSLRALPSHAETEGVYSFSSVWEMTQRHSPEIQAAGHEVEAAKIGAARASRHWFPRLYLDFRVFETNDPAMNFMSILGQRQFQMSDFSPDALNNPGSHLYERGSLGLDLPLYEGGAKAAMAEAARKTKEAKEWELKSSKLGQYTELAGRYASLLVLKDEHHQFRQLLDRVQETISTYRIGSKANPVGYSGLLGLKNLKNRLMGLLNQITAQQASLQNQIRVVAQDLPKDWQIQNESTKRFIERVFPAEKAQEGRPSSVVAAQSGADALENAKPAERARYLPRVGLFAEGNLYGGNRAAATSYNSGAYVQWDLFSASNFGSVTQASETSAAARARSESFAQRSRAERQTSLESIDTLNANLALMDDSAQLLEEQTATARSLFRNGSINALQWVEVLARRVDLLVNRAETQQALIQAHSALLTSSSSESLIQETDQ